MATVLLSLYHGFEGLCETLIRVSAYQVELFYQMNMTRTKSYRESYLVSEDEDSYHGCVFIGKIVAYNTDLVD